MTGRAILISMICAGMVEFKRKPGECSVFKIRRGQTVTTRTVIAIGFLILIMAGETRRMRIGRIFEKCSLWRERFGIGIGQRAQ